MSGNDGSVSGQTGRDQYFYYERSALSVPVSGGRPPLWPPMGPHVPYGEAHTVWPLMWTPMDGYYRPKGNCQSNDHSIGCCLSAQSATGCQQKERQICLNCRQTDRQLNTNESSAAVDGYSTGSKAPTDEERDSKADSNERQISGINCALKSSLEDMTHRLRQTQTDMIKSFGRLAIQAIDRYDDGLKALADDERQEWQRFSDNDSIGSELMAFEERLNSAREAAKAEGNRIDSEISAQKALLSEDINARCEAPVVDWKALPDLGQLIAYRQKIDRIAVKGSDESVVPSDEKRDQSLIDFKSDEQLNAKTVNGEEVVDNGCDGGSEAETNEVSAELESTVDELVDRETTYGKTFGADIHPIIALAFDSLSASSEERPAETVSALSYSSSMDSNMNIESNENSMNENSKRMESSTTETDDESRAQTKPIVSQSMQKLLDRLKAKYEGLSDEVLLDSVVKTRELLLSCGHRKGFNGLKISEIVNRISEYIETNGLLSTLCLSNGGDQLLARQCSLCSERVLTEAEKITLSCEHAFHALCIEAWAQQNSRCPDCPQPF